MLRAREDVTMPPPGDISPARFRVVSRDLVWEWIYLRINTFINDLSTRMNYLQFLTIRRYLGLVMVSLVTLLLVLTIWN